MQDPRPHPIAIIIHSRSAHVVKLFAVVVPSLVINQSRRGTELLACPMTGAVIGNAGRVGARRHPVAQIAGEAAQLTRIVIRIGDGAA